MRKPALALVADVPVAGPTSILDELVASWTRSLKARPASPRTTQQFFRWLIEEKEITESPAQHMRPPKPGVVPPPVLREQQLHALFKTCEGEDFESRRDTAIMSIFYDCGIRRAEMAS